VWSFPEVLDSIQVDQRVLETLDRENEALRVWQLDELDDLRDSVESDEFLNKQVQFRLRVKLVSYIQVDLGFVQSLLALCFHLAARRDFGDELLKKLDGVGCFSEEALELYFLAPEVNLK